MKLAQIQILTHHAVLISLDKNYIKVLKVAVFIKIVMVIKRVLRGVREVLIYLLNLYWNINRIIQNLIIVIQ